MDPDDDSKRDRIGSAHAGTNPTVLARLTRPYAVMGDTQLLEPPEHVGRPVWLYDPATFYGPAAALGPRHDELRARIVAALWLS